MSSKVTIKRNLIIFHKPGDWHDIYSQILRDYGMGMAVRTRLRRELGFSYRMHQGLVPNEIQMTGMPNMHYEQQVHLDFYNTEALTWFQLKYLHL